MEPQLYHTPGLRPGGSLSSDQNHELRSPLTTILGYAEMLLDTPDLDPTVAEHVQTIRRAGRQLLEVVQRLSRSASGQVPVASSAMPQQRTGEATQQTMMGDDRRNHATMGATNGAEAARPLGRVLFAEDGKDNQKLVSYLLRRSNLNVTLADDGAQALQSATEAATLGRGFDLILMDMDMPVMDGCASTRAIRAAGLSVPIIALTAHALAGDRERCLAAGCDDYLTKPLDRLALAQMLSRFIPALQGREPTSASMAPVGLSPVPTTAERRPDALASLASRYADRADMRPLIEAFLDALPGTVSRLAQLLNSGDGAALRQATHDFKGAAIGFGFDSLGTLANAVDVTIRLGADRPTVTAAVDRLMAAMRRAAGPDRFRSRAA